MSDSRLPKLFFVLLLLLGLLNWARVYPQLPDSMASHFAGDGTPNGWEPKPFFFALMALILAMSAFVAFLVPRLVAAQPDSRINLPNKLYWLSPTHRQETMRYFAAQMAWFGCALLFVLLYGTSQAINANLRAIGYFDSRAMWYVMAGFLLFTFVWLIHFVRHFVKVPEPHSSAPPDSLRK
jgi:uncharacterized membrane protein